MEKNQQEEIKNAQRYHTLSKLDEYLTQLKTTVVHYLPKLWSVSIFL